MDPEHESSAWAQLVCTTDNDSEPVSIHKDKFTIGRAKACDLSLSSNKLVSGTHCFIEKDEDGKVWLYDSSTNGTLLNLAEKVFHECHELKHGDEFHVVYKKSDDNFNVGYVFQDVKQLQQEALHDFETSVNSELDSTLLDEERFEPDEGKKRSLSTECSSNWGEQISSKRPKLQDEATIVATQPETSHVVLTSNQKLELTTSHTDEGEGSKLSTVKESTACSKLKTDTVLGEKQEEHVKCDEAKPEDNVVEKIDKDADKVPEKAESSSKATDDFEEPLLCIICQEIFHDCISLQPCMHCFCAGCYSEWMTKSKKCPSCRVKVERINKNHMVNNLVDLYLAQRPDKKRPEEDIKELDLKNKITRDMLYKHLERAQSSGSDDDYNSDGSEIGSDDGGSQSNNNDDAMPDQTVNGMLFGLGTPLYGAMRPAAVICRQCPTYTAPAVPKPSTIVGLATKAVQLIFGNTAAAPSEDASITTPETSTSSAGVPQQQGESVPGTSGQSEWIRPIPIPPPYQCIPKQNHALCTCCLQPMPDRRHEHAINPLIPSMSCSLCYRNYCHSYWGCRKADCRGCLAKFKDLDFNPAILSQLILDNTYESDILKTYLESKKLSLHDVLQSCLIEMELGRYICVDKGRFALTSESWVCYACGLRNFKELAYFYRRDIAKDKLPILVTTRADCYWGKNCRTQKNKPAHAANFNHICDQTRT